jgi:hypothetical protein
VRSASRSRPGRRLGAVPWGDYGRQVRELRVYVESDVSMADDHVTAAWVFEVDVWGRCGQGCDEAGALAALRAELDEPGPGVGLVVVERIVGDEQAFDRDRVPATAAERAATVMVLDAARRETLGLLSGLPDAVLDHDDAARVLPEWATWRTLRQMAWHLADTESRYYLPSLGLPARDRHPDLVTELAASAAAVRKAVLTMPADLVRHRNGQAWTTTKVLRRLAWHERCELRVLHHLAAHAADALRANP